MSSGMCAQVSEAAGLHQVGLYFEGFVNDEPAVLEEYTRRLSHLSVCVTPQEMSLTARAQGKQWNWRWQKGAHVDWILASTYVNVKTIIYRNLSPWIYVLELQTREVWKYTLYCRRQPASPILASFPGPSPSEERPGTHYLRMHEIFSVKSFVHFLVRMRKIILAKNTELSLN